MNTKSITIPVNLLTLISWVGENKYHWWFQNTCEELEDNRILPFIVSEAFDRIPSIFRRIFSLFCVNQISLTKETEAYFRERGFIQGKPGAIPKLVKAEGKFYYNYVYKNSNFY